MSRRQRYAIVGTGSRAGLYIDAISGPYRETAELVGLCDLSQTRMAWHNRRLEAEGLTPDQRTEVTTSSDPASVSYSARKLSGFHVRT
jgi:predicted dehydrogenase